MWQFPVQDVFLCLGAVCTQSSDVPCLIADYRVVPLNCQCVPVFVPVVHHTAVLYLRGFLLGMISMDRQNTIHYKPTCKLSTLSYHKPINLVSTVNRKPI